MGTVKLWCAGLQLCPSYPRAYSASEAFPIALCWFRLKVDELVCSWSFLDVPKVKNRCPVVADPLSVRNILSSLHVTPVWLSLDFQKVAIDLYPSVYVAKPHAFIREQVIEESPINRTVHVCFAASDVLLIRHPVYQSPE